MDLLARLLLVIAEDPNRPPGIACSPLTLAVYTGTFEALLADAPTKLRICGWDLNFVTEGVPERAPDGFAADIKSYVQRLRAVDGTLERVLRPITPIGRDDGTYALIQLQNVRPSEFSAMRAAAGPHDAGRYVRLRAAIDDLTRQSPGSPHP